MPAHVEGLGIIRLESATGKLVRLSRTEHEWPDRSRRKQSLHPAHLQQLLNSIKRK